MSNQESSPPVAPSAGTTGPIESSFELAWTRLGKAGSSEAKHNARIVWYFASLAVYNIMVQGIHALKTNPEVIVILTQAIKHELDKFMETADGPVEKGDLGTGHSRH